jgi:hypothetical protein
MIELNAVPERMPGAFTRRAGGGVLIEGYLDGYQTNESGAYIWSRCGTGDTVEDIAGRLAAKCGIDISVARNAVTQFVAGLRDVGLLTVGSRKGVN